MKLVVALALVVLFGPGAAIAQGLTPSDYAYLKATHGLTAQSQVIADLTANEQQALHSAIDDLKTYPEGRDRQVRRYLWLVYARECKRWAAEHPDQQCAPAADPTLRPGKQISDRNCAECHLFGTVTAPTFHAMAAKRDWNSHKVEHALRHSPDMVPLKLTPEMLDQLAAYINSFKP